MQYGIEQQLAINIGNSQQAKTKNFLTNMLLTLN